LLKHNVTKVVSFKSDDDTFISHIHTSHIQIKLFVANILIIFFSVSSFENNIEKSAISSSRGKFYCSTTYYSSY